MRRQYVIAASFGLFILFGSMLAVGAAAQAGLEQRVDSLFVIASSGEVKYRDMVEPAIEAIAAMGVDAVPVLIDKFATRSARERLTITNILKKIGVPAVPLLVEALSRSDGQIVQRVCAVLGDIGDTAAVGPLMAVTGHSRWQVRDQAVGALGKIGDRRADSVVMAALDDAIGEVRKAAAVSSGMLTIGASARKLVHVLGDDFYGARMSAAHSLLSLDTVTVKAVLADSLGSANHFVGDLGCFILSEYTGDDQALNLLYSQSASSNARRRAHAAVGIIKADPDDLCGWHQLLVDRESDRLARLKMQSALKSLKNEE
ncbi:MAG: HEAT repeat domain-containing protein [candidate division Zixibacteria bacterium]|nr:HEAT repeat domain-containing protein [candidate division Zixibacteria bacterium]